MPDIEIGGLRARHQTTDLTEATHRVQYSSDCFGVGFDRCDVERREVGLS